MTRRSESSSSSPGLTIAAIVDRSGHARTISSLRAHAAR